MAEDLTLLHQFNEIISGQAEVNPVWLTALALVGGLLSSVSPCVLGLLPVNLAYIGTADIKDKKQAFNKALTFVLGVAFVLTLLGLFSTFAFAVFTEYKGIINFIVGLFILLMALFVVEIIRLPLPQFVTRMPEASPFVIGMIFALVSSPCSSPVLFGVVSAAAATGSQLWAMLIMFAYSIGYTAIIFFASLFTGLIKQLDWFKKNNKKVLNASGALLLIMGLFYLYIGASELWF